MFFYIVRFSKRMRRVLGCLCLVEFCIVSTVIMLPSNGNHEFLFSALQDLLQGTLGSQEVKLTGRS